MPITISPALQPFILLLMSNVFMTFAWYGHLKYKEHSLPLVIMVSWGIAFFEYCIAVARQSLGQCGLFGSAAQDHAGSHYAGGVRRFLGAVPEGAARLESRDRLCLYRRRRVLHFPQMVVSAAVVIVMAARLRRDQKSCDEDDREHQRR